jgi:hypothetical protein
MISAFEVKTSENKIGRKREDGSGKMGEGRWEREDGRGKMGEGRWEWEELFSLTAEGCVLWVFVFCFLNWK